MKLARMPTAAVLGVASGTLSYLTVQFYPKFLTVKSLTGWGEDGISLFPGVIFGVALALSVALHERGRPPAKLIVAVLLVFVGWAFAYHASLFAYSPIEGLLPSGMERVNREALTLALALNVGNLIGGVFTILAVATAAGRRIPGSGWALALVTGGLVVLFDVYGVGAGRESQILLVLFVLWQSGMLTTLHGTLMRLEEEEARA